MLKWTPKKIRELRKGIGLTQKDFAKRLGVTSNYIYLIEKKGGEKKPSATLSLLLDCIQKERR